MLRDIGICLVVAGGLAGCQPSASPRSPETATVTLGPARAPLVTPRSVGGNDIPYNGNDDGTDVLLQGFHWNSHAFNQNGQRWYGHLESLLPSGANEGTWSHNSHIYENEDFVGSPDLNHWNSATRNTIKAWLKWLKEKSNAGFDGWRYDMIGGYDPTFLGEYNFDSQPYLSVGEKPTGDRQYLADIVNRAGNQTMVFDFAMREALVRALDDINHMDGAELGVAGATNTEKGLVGWWSNAAVTFVNNHDTQPDHTPVGQVFPWGVPGNSSGVSTQAAYAFILTHPGIPTVFFLDWKDRGSDLSRAIDNLIRIRQANGVLRNSRVFVDRAEDGLYAAYVGEENTEQLAVKIGKTGWNNYETWVPNPALGLSQAFTRFEASAHAYCVFYKNAVPISN